MSCPSFLRTWFSVRPGRIRFRRRKGAITLISLFIFFIFCTLGMGMLLMSQIYLKISGYKKNVVLLNYASENGVKQGFAFFMEKISLHSNPIVITDLELAHLKGDAMLGGTQILDNLTGLDFPFEEDASWEWMNWEIQTTCTLDTVDIEEEFFRTSFAASIESQGAVYNFKPKKSDVLEFEMEVYSGYLPLALFPFLLSQELTSEQKSDFTDQNPIEFIPPVDNKLPQHIETTGENVLPRSAVPQIEEALKIDLFQPQTLTNAQLRQALGLEPSDESIPDGVYLIHDYSGLGGIFVQGDCKELILAIDGDFQVISFSIGEHVWELKFSLNPQTTQFTTPDEVYFYEEAPEEILIINGSVLSLGGGIIDDSGRAEFVIDAEIPSLLNGVNLTIISSDTIKISSHLIHQGLKWQKGIPYIKESTSMLNIFATGTDIFGTSETAGHIVIDSEAPQNLVINAALTSSGDGFLIEGQDKTIHLLGGLQTTEYVSHGNLLKVKPDDRILKENDLRAFSPKTLHPLLKLTSLRVRGWHER